MIVLRIIDIYEDPSRPMTGNEVGDSHVIIVSRLGILLLLSLRKRWLERRWLGRWQLLAYLTLENPQSLISSSLTTSETSTTLDSTPYYLEHGVSLGHLIDGGFGGADPGSMTFSTTELTLENGKTLDITDQTVNYYHFSLRWWDISL